MNSQFHAVDMNSFPRRSQYEYFSSMANPYIALTVNVDVTALRAYASEKGLPFFLTALYALERAANSVPEFRRRVSDGTLVEYDWCFSSYTVALPDQTYCYCEVDARLPFDEFIPDAQARQERAMANPSLTDEDPLALLYVSSLPWVSFTGLSLPTPQPADSVPRLTIGKYFLSGERLMMPLAIQVHHALMDGWHIAKMLEGLEREIKALHA